VEYQRKRVRSVKSKAANDRIADTLVRYGGEQYQPANGI